MESSDKVSNKWLALLGADILAMTLMYLIAGRSIFSWYRQQINVHGVTLTTILTAILFNIVAFLIINYILYLLIIPKSMRSKTKQHETDKTDRV